jgi:hypothetical protein
MLQSSVLIDAVFCLLREGKKEKKKRETELVRVFFPQGRYALLAMLCWDFPVC